MKKLLFSDLDLTLLNDDKSVNELSRAAISNLIESGGYFAISTGRPLMTTKKIIEMLDFNFPNYYAVTYNGALIYDCYNKTTIFEKTIPKDTVKEVFELAEKHGLFIQTYEGDYILASREDENLLDYSKLYSLSYKAGEDILKQLIHEPHKCLIIDINNPQRIYEFLKEEESFFKEKELDTVFSNDYYLEVIPKGVSKAAGNAKLAEILGVDIADTVACGDERNDISMIKAAGVGVAVKNARDDVKAIADYITSRTNNEGAVAEVVERFLL